MHKLVGALAVGAVMSLSAGAASAVTFSFGAGSDDQSAVTLLEDGISLTVTAFKNYVGEGDPLNETGLINRAAAGWGVEGRPGGNRLDEGNGDVEAFVLSFSEEVSLRSATLTEGGNNDSNALLLNSSDAQIFDFTIANGSPPVRFSLGPTAPSEVFFGDQFVLLGDNPGGGVRLLSVVAAVPVPPALGFLIVALGGLGFLTRKRA